MPLVKSPVSVATHTRVRPIAHELGIRPSPLFWDLVHQYEMRSIHPLGNPGIDRYTESIVQTEIDLRKELLGPPLETRKVRRTSEDCDLVEGQIHALTEALLTLFPCSR